MEILAFLYGHIRSENQTLLSARSCEEPGFTTSGDERIMKLVIIEPAFPLSYACLILISLPAFYHPTKAPFDLRSVPWRRQIIASFFSAPLLSQIIELNDVDD